MATIPTNMRNVLVDAISGGWLNLNLRQTTYSGVEEDHSMLYNLDYDNAGHTGFASEAMLALTSGTLQDEIDGIVLGAVSWSSIAGKPLVFPPETHGDAAHSVDYALYSELTSTSGVLQDAIDNIDLSSYATTVALASVSGSLQNQLDNLTTDHGDLTGLSDNDHPQYLLGTDFVIASGILNDKIDTTSGTLQADITNIYNTYATDLELTTVSGSLQYQLDNLTTDHGELLGLTDDDHPQYSRTDGSRNITGQQTFEDNVVIQGNLVVSGTQFIVEVEDVLIEDHLLTLNYGETASGISFPYAGIEIERGTAENFLFVYDETDDNFQVGVSGSLQPVATREDTPLSSGIALWNASLYRFDTIPSTTYASSVHTHEGTEVFLHGTFTADDLLNIQSAGKISGGVISDGTTSGTVLVSSGTGFIKTTNAANADTRYFDIPATDNIAIDDQATSYIYVDWNSGTPTVGAETTKTKTGRTAFYLGSVFREGANRHYLNAGLNITEEIKNTQGRFVSQFGEVSRASGGLVSETGTRNIAITAATLWAGLTKITTSALDTSGTDEFEYYYRNGSGGWIEADATQISNTLYDNGTGTLATLAANRYGVHWIFLSNDGEVLVLYGRASYTLTTAQASTVPSDLPPHIEGFATLVARIIIFKSAAVFTEIDNVADTVFVTSAPGDHGELSGLLDDDHTQYLLGTDFTIYSGTLQTQINGKAPTSHSHDDLYYTETEVNTISGNITSQLHSRSHAISSTSDHTANNWKVFYSNGSGQVVELALSSTSGTVLTSNGASAIPSFTSISGSGITDIVQDLTPQLGGDLDLNNKGIEHSTSRSSTYSYEGDYILATVQTGSQGYKLVYWYSEGAGFIAARANSGSTMPCVGITVENSSGSNKKILVRGTAYINHDGGDFTIGGLVYVSDLVAGNATQTKPTDAGTIIQPIGFATNTDTIYFDPQLAQTIEEIHNRSHTITSTSDHTAGNHKVFYSNGSGQIQELSLSTSGTVLSSNGTTSAPSFNTIATNFLALSDTPDSYTGQENKYVKVNSGGTTLEFSSTTVSGHGNELHTAAFITSAGVTYDNLNGNSDVGTGADQVAVGNHSHAQLHDRSHTMTSTSDHTSGNWKLFYSNGSGEVVELALGADNTVLKSSGTSSAPGFTTVSGIGISNVVEDTSPELGGSLDMNNKYITFTAAPTSDHSGSGFMSMVDVATNTYGAAGALYLKSDGSYYDATCSGVATMPCSVLAIETGAGSKYVLHQGYMRDDTWNWTVGGLIYVSSTNGTLTQTLPSTTGHQVQIVGYATHVDRMYFNPNFAIAEVK